MLHDAIMRLHATCACTHAHMQVFRLDYMGRPGCLAQSPQFYKQMAVVSDMPRVFEIGPVFRCGAGLAFQPMRSVSRLSVHAYMRMQHVVPIHAGECSMHSLRPCMHRAALQPHNHTCRSSNAFLHLLCSAEL